MTAEQAIKREILLTVFKWLEKEPPAITVDNVDSIWDTQEEDHPDYIQDAKSEFRCSGEETGIKHDQWSRHYEVESVGRKLSDGSWVGWLHFHGGGKHSEPDAIPFMGDSYYLDVVEEQKVVTVRSFSKK